MGMKKQNKSKLTCSDLFIYYLRILDLDAETTNNKSNQINKCDPAVVSVIR